MEYVKFGNIGMDVLKICLGIMGFGDKDKWIYKWVLNEVNSCFIIKKVFDLGINFFDMVNIYFYGESEKIVGCVLKDYVNCDDVVLVIKV